MKINQKSFVLALVAAAGIAAIATTKVRASADTQLLALMPPDSQILIGGRIDQAVISPVGQYLLAKIGAGPDQLKNKTGFDVRTDLREVMAAPVAKFGAALGRFPVSQIEDLMKESGDSAEDYRGFKLWGKTNERVAFLDGSTLVAGKPEAVQQAIDRWVSHAPAPDNAMTAKVAEVSATSQAWFAATSIAALQTEIGQNAPEPIRNILQKISAVSGQLTLPQNGGALAQGEVRATSAEDAQTLVDAFNALKLLAPAEAVNNPVFSQLQPSVNGSTIHFSIVLTQQQAESLFARNSQPRL